MIDEIRVDFIKKLSKSNRKGECSWSTAKSQDLIFATCLWNFATCPCNFPRHVLDILRHVAEFCDFLRHVAKSQGHVAKSQGHVASRKRHVAKSQRHVAKFCDLSKCPCDFLRHSATCLRFLRHASSTSPTAHPFFIWLSCLRRVAKVAKAVAGSILWGLFIVSEYLTCCSA
jgi:hypothetical protein